VYAAVAAQNPKAILTGRKKFFVPQKSTIKEKGWRLYKAYQEFGDAIFVLDGVMHWLYCKKGEILSAALGLMSLSRIPGIRQIASKLTY
jgi:hypothetical protein